MGDVAYDEDGNPIFPLSEELLAMIESGEIDPDDIELPIFDDGDGTEDRGDRPRLMVLG